MATTIKDLAQETGLSLATISSYINGGNVREKNRQKIESAIQKHGYVVNEMARSLKTNKSMTIGIIVPELKSNFFANIISEAEDILRHHGYSVLVCDCRTDPEREQDAVDFLLRKRVDGIINAPVTHDGRHLRQFFDEGKAVVLIDRKIECISCDCVIVDNINAVRKAVRTLVENGHTKIGYIGGPQSVYTSAQRTLGYKYAMEENGLPVEDRLVVGGNFTIQGGADAMTHLVRTNPDMSAVIATNDEMTVGCMIAANEMDLRIPGDISIIGFDHLDFSSACSPRLTIISQPSLEIARCASSLLLRRLAGDTGATEELRLSTSITSGKSIAKLNG